MTLSYEFSQPCPNSTLPQHGSLLQGLRILVVDDDRDSVDLAAIILDRYSAETITASSAMEALDQWQCQQPHLLISDLAMPEQDGCWLLDQIKHQSPPATEVLAIAWTACVFPQDRARAFASGYQRFVQKPIDIERLVATVANLAGRSL